MSCVKNSIYCHDCNRSYLDINYQTHLRSQGHIIFAMKRRCYSCNSAITRSKICCNKHDLACCMSKLSLE